MEKLPTLETMMAIVATLLFGHTLGPVVSTLALIVFGWFGGMLIGLLRLQTSDNTPEKNRVKTLWFVIVSFIVTIGTAGTAATWLSAHTAGAPADWLFIVAVVVPAIGTDWVRIGKWFASLVGRGVERMVESRMKE